MRDARSRCARSGSRRRLQPSSFAPSIRRRPHGGVEIEMTLGVALSSALCLEGHRRSVAKVAAKLAVGYTLREIATTSPSAPSTSPFEPTCFHYFVTKFRALRSKIARPSHNTLTTSM